MRANILPSRRALGLAAALCLTAAPALSQTVIGAQGVTAAANAGPAMVRVDLAGGGASQSLALPTGKSALIDLPVDARDVLVSNPGVADVVLRSPRRISVIGVKEGTTDAVFFDAAGRRILSLSIHVDFDTIAVSEMINRVLPGSRVHAEGMSGSIVLSGQVASPGDADKAVQIARAAVSKPEQVLNMISIAGKDQVMLKVRIVEMQREVIKQLGFNMQALLNQIGEPQYLLGFVPTFGINGSILGGINGGYKLNTQIQPEVKVFNPLTGQYDLTVVDRNSPIATPQPTAGDPGLNQANATIQAFERVGLVRTLAEPNLTAISGESAKFLAGGEFPVPTGQDNAGKVSIEFKPFGVGLGFTPVVLSGGRISLKISTEVSELSNQGAFSISSGSGSPVLVVPSLTVRRAETTVELPSGGAMMIAGLLNDKSKQDLDSVPGMMNLPVLGALFRSRDYQAGQTELVIIVTPYLVNPTSPQNLQTPADGMRVASDPETVLLGRLNKTYNHPPQATAGRTYQGPYGYVVE
jgi:pilus assembly protein CpaC